MEDSNISPFELIKQVAKNGREFWLSRSFAAVLGYANYRNFETVIEKARIACKNSGYPVEENFADVMTTVELGSGAQREVTAVAFTRYACYLIIQNADPSKEIVALGQTYFAVQTRRQELSDIELEDNRCLLLRDEMKKHNTQLAEAASEAGVIDRLDYAIFQNFGYKGLYDGLDASAIHSKKGLKKSQKILDHMGSTELAANLFRATQTEEKLRREKIKGKAAANNTHFEVGAKVRKTIQELGSTMPEDLPVAESIKKLKPRHPPKPQEIDEG